jgi:hypothetical protein
MIQYVCDTCSAIKKPDDLWIVGLAAEAVGVTSAQREVTLQSVWSRTMAVHPFAVHFCSTKCKDEYMARLFAPETPAQVVPEEEVVVERKLPAEVVVNRTIPKKERTTTKKKVVTKTRSRHKRAA